MAFLTFLNGWLNLGFFGIANMLRKLFKKSTILSAHFFETALKSSQMAKHKSNNMNMRERSRNGIEERLFKHCGSLVFVTSLTPPIEVLRNGTYGLVDTGKKKVVVTCHHVWNYLQEAQLKYPKAEIAMTLAPGHSFAVSGAEIIDADPELDIVIVDPKLPDENFFQKEFFRISNQPTAPIQAGEAIAFVGYPEAGFVCSDNRGTFRSSFFALHVSGVNDRAVLLLNDRNDRRFVGLYGEPLDPIKMSGISGSPAYRVGASGLELIGLVKEGFNNEGLIKLAKICLNPDGKIRR
jgi:hypothetical protein